MMAEKPLTHHKRKANPDKMKPEMRQLEDDFTVYDFERTPRRSYYPHNQPIIAAYSNTDPMKASPSPTNTYVDSRSRSPSPSEQVRKRRSSSQHNSSAR